MPTDLAEAVELDEERAVAMWNALTPSQRERAARRFGALQLWGDGQRDVDVGKAASAAGVSVSRFYRIAAEWRKLRSFESLGVFANRSNRTSTISPEVSASLMEAARKAVIMSGGGSTSALVAHTLRIAALDPGGRLPGMTKLREIVSAEARRMLAYAPLGQTILFDCVATSLPRSDGRPHVAFVCIDGGTGVVLGVAVGKVDVAARGYAIAANDALRAIDGCNDWRWANVFTSMRIAAGEDFERMVKVVHRLNAMFLASHFILERGDGRYGRLITKTIGSRLGRVVFTPTRTVSGEALATNGDMTAWTEKEALAELRRAADAHNRPILSEGLQGSEQIPDHLYEALVTIGADTGLP